VAVAMGITTDPRWEHAQKGKFSRYVSLHFGMLKTSAVLKI
jgi:hypothetical protein